MSADPLREAVSLAMFDENIDPTSATAILMAFDAARAAAPSERLRELVDRQAEDEGLWFVPETAAEAYLQQELRRLHAAIEGAPIPDPPLMTDRQVLDVLDWLAAEEVLTQALADTLSGSTFSDERDDWFYMPDDWDAAADRAARVLASIRARRLSNGGDIPLIARAVSK